MGSEPKYHGAEITQGSGIWFGHLILSNPESNLGFADLSDSSYLVPPTQSRSSWKDLRIRHFLVSCYTITAGPSQTG
jgi:hypothetical protein